MQTATQRDYLKENADNVWFVLGAYFFAFFPWAVMNNIDFVSEKWRKCSRTRTLAHQHLASYIIPIVYVAVYAEAQRRDGDSKELGAALAALMFNIYQVLRTIMGLVQLNAFVAWCKDAMECIRALDGDYYGVSSSSSESEDEGLRDKTRRMIEVVGRCRKEVPSWCKRVWQWMRTLVCRDGENGEQQKNGGRENGESSINVNVGGNDGDGGKEDIGPSPGKNGENRNKEADAEAETNLNVEENSQSVARVAESVDGASGSNSRSGMGRRNTDDWNWIEEKIMVNNMVVDNELGGRDVSVVPRWEKIWRELKKGKFTPSNWLHTDQVVLNTVRWGGAYLCGMGKCWSIDRHHRQLRSKSGEILKAFFSMEMYGARSFLQRVEWVVKVVNDGREFLAINAIGSNDVVKLAGEMSTAYGSRLTRYDVEDTYTVEAFSFEFESLVSSYPSTGDMYSIANRERVEVGLVHSVLLAKHLGVEKLQAIRRYYDEYRVPEGAILRNAFKLLVEQTDRDVSDDAMIWRMFDSEYDIPLFPYRMQMVASWDEATNWRVLQASAINDAYGSLEIAEYFESENENETWDLHKIPHPLNIFDDCAKWTAEKIGRTSEGVKGLLGVVMETVRTFLAEWVTASAQEANWEPEIPAASADLKTGDIPIFEKTGDIGRFEKAMWLTWICQRELQRKVAKMSREDEDFTGNAALIMLFILGFPRLRVVDRQETSADGQESQDNADEASGASSSNPHQTIDLNTEIWRASTPLAPQDISVIIQIDKNNHTACLRLQNDSGDARFMWQDWVDAAMGFLKGFEEGKEGKWGYGRKILKANLQTPMVEMCPLLIDGDGIEKKVVRTRTARMWMGWPVFDLDICKFEVEQWLDAVNVNIQRDETVVHEVGRVEYILGEEKLRIANLAEKIKRNG